MTGAARSQDAIHSRRLLAVRASAVLTSTLLAGCPRGEEAPRASAVMSHAPGASGAGGDPADSAAPAEGSGPVQQPGVEAGAGVEEAHPVPEAPAPDPCGPVPPDMACVRGGTFMRGVDRDADGCVQMGDPSGGRVQAATPAMQITLHPYLLDLHEVTNAEYRACVEAGACRRVGPLYRGFSGDDQPHTGGSWYDARDFCAWRGARLPTESEFEFAMRGPEGERTPFGDALVTCENAVIMDASGRSCGVPQPSDEPEKGRVLPVGSRPAGRFGLFDLAGNAEEWVFDWWTPSWSDCGADCAGIDPRGPCGGEEPCEGSRYRAVRGGSWYWGPECATGYHRRRYQPDNDPPHHFGFRCARSVSGDEHGSGAGAVSPP